MIEKVINLIVIFFCSGFSCFSQQLPKNTISISYYGEFFTHPGFAIDGWHNIIPTGEKEVNRVKHLVQVGIGFSAYAHVQSHYAISLTPEIGYQFLLKKGFSFRSNAGLGYMRQFNDGKTYGVSEDGNVHEIKLAGRNKLTTFYSLGMGQNLFKRSNVPFSWHFDMGIFTESPTNTGFIPHLFIKTGIEYFFNCKHK